MSTVVLIVPLEFLYLWVAGVRAIVADVRSPCDEPCRQIL